jgi:myo-inositol 2-dehydrogenase/D-chiro-inositol 1-dehydrogenase
MNVSAGFGYQVATEAVFQSGIARIGQPSGMERWSEGAFRIAEHVTYTTRFARAYDTQVQAWVDAVNDGSLVAGPTAWDGYLVSLSCEAGVLALSQTGPVDVRPVARPAFYA